MNNLEFEQMTELIRLKKEKPEEYKEFLEDYKGVTRDIFKMAMELANETE